MVAEFVTMNFNKQGNPSENEKVIHLKRSKKTKVSKRTGIWAILLMFTVVLSGCGQGEAEQKIAQGNQAIEAGDYEKGIEIFEKLEVIKGNKKEVYRGLGIAYLGLEEYENSIQALEKSLQESEGKVGTWEYDTSYYLAAAYEKNGQRQEAIEVYSNILALDKQTEAFFLRGVLYLQSGKEEKAEKDFDQAVAMEKKSQDLCLKIYEQWEETDKSRGEKYLQKILDTKASTGEELYYRGLAYEKLGEKNAAMDTLRQAVDQGYSEANLVLGRLYEDPESMDAALACYEAYMKANHDSKKAYYELADFQITSEDYQGALETVQKGLSIEGSKGHRELLQCEIACYEYLQDYETARNKAESYLKDYPYDKNVEKELDFLKTR